MDRRTLTPRADWQQQVEAVGMIYHHTDGQVYWKESACYRLTAADVALIEPATAELWNLCLAAVQHIIDARRYADLGIPDAAIPLIEESWNDDHPSIYGRFDLGYRSGSTWAKSAGARIAASPISTSARSAPSSSSTRGNGCCATASARTSDRAARPAGSSLRGGCCSPTRRSSPSCGS